MAEIIVRLAEDRERLIDALKKAKLPFTAKLTRGTHRSLEQNRLQFLWMREAAEQDPSYTAEEHRAFCKLHFAVPIMRGEDDHFREMYDKHIKPKSYEDKLELMVGPLEVPVTSLMKTGQLKRYLDDVYAHFTALGVKLTEPDG